MEPITFEEWLRQNGITKEGFYEEGRQQGKSEEHINFEWYRLEDLYLFETNQ